MNGRMVKKLNRIARRNWREYYKEICKLPLGTRVLFAWHIIIKY